MTKCWLCGTLSPLKNSVLWLHKLPGKGRVKLGIAGSQLHYRTPGFNTGIRMAAYGISDRAMSCKATAITLWMHEVYMILHKMMKDRPLIHTDKKFSHLWKAIFEDTFWFLEEGKKRTLFTQVISKPVTKSNGFSGHWKSFSLLKAHTNPTTIVPPAVSHFTTQIFVKRKQGFFQSPNYHKITNLFPLWKKTWGKNICVKKELS